MTTTRRITAESVKGVPLPPPSEELFNRMESAVNGRYVGGIEVYEDGRVIRPEYSASEIVRVAYAALAEYAGARVEEVEVQDV